MKEKFYEHVTEVLKPLGFTFKDNVWVCEKDTQRGNMTVVINGQTQNVPGSTVHQKWTFSVTGTGTIDNRDFLQVALTEEKTQEEETESVTGPDECIYLDEPEMFEKLFLR